MKESLVQTYLFFGGRCEEALEFYRTALGAKTGMVMRYKESPEPLPADRVPAGYGDKIMHAEFTVGGSTLMASDGCGEEPGFDGFSLSLALPTEEAAGRAFAALCEGGRVSMPLGKTFWSPCFGMVTDRFGLGWMITVRTENHP